MLTTMSKLEPNQSMLFMAGEEISMSSETNENSSNLLMQVPYEQAKCTISAVKKEEGVVYNVLLYDVITLPKYYMPLFRLCSKATERDEINVYGDSIGGNLATAISIAVAIKNTKAKTKMIALGDIMSAMTVIIDCGENTEISKYAHFMFHMSSSGGMGNTTQVIEVNQQTFGYILDYLKVAVKNKSITTEEFDLIVNRRQDVYITGQEMAKRLGKTVL